MPIYEYQCKHCGEIRTDLRSIADRDKPLVEPCVDRPLHPIEVDLIARGKAKQFTCTFEIIMSATPTTFRFNDFQGYRGLDETRGNRGPKKRTVDKVLKQ